MKFRFLVVVLMALSSISFAQENSESQEESATTVSEAVDAVDDTPVTFEEIGGDKGLTNARPWRAPDYSQQQMALGWSEDAFAIPKGLEKNVAFWIDIYSKYSTDQGVIHDAEYIDLVYEVLDFTSISSSAQLNGFQKERLKLRRVKESKKRVTEMLKKFEKVKDPSSLSDDEKKIWEYFTKIDGKKKFQEAAGKNRMRFQLGQRDRVMTGIYFSGRYIEEFEKIFRDAGLPIELTRLPFVESSYNVFARSKVGASGLWQIMPRTGKPFMMINEAVDKRNYPAEATKLAAKLLKTNYQMLQAWPLALTGYNHGPTGVLKLTKAFKSRELADLGQNNKSKRRLGFASRNFYPSFLAILEVEKHANKYYGNIPWSQPLNESRLIVTRPVAYKDVLKWFDGDDHKVQIFNPHISSKARNGKIIIPRGALISVPENKESEVMSDLASEPPQPEPKKKKRNQKTAAESSTL